MTAETMEMRKVAERQLLALETKVLELREEVLRAAQSAETALGYEQTMLERSDQEMASLLGAVRQTLLRLDLADRDEAHATLPR